MSRRTPHLLIAGTRTFCDFPLLCSRLDPLVDDGPWVVVSGGAPGADALGERWADLNGYGVRRFDADWDRHGRAAGPVRNTKMTAFLVRKKETCRVEAVVFWDGSSPGTKDMLRNLKHAGIPTRVVEYPRVRVVRENRDEEESEEIVNPPCPLVREILHPQAKLTPEQRARCKPKNYRGGGRPRRTDAE